MRDVTRDDTKEQPAENAESQIENGSDSHPPLTQISAATLPGTPLMVFFVTSFQTRQPSRYRRRRSRTGARLARMQRRELRYSRPSLNDVGR